MRTRGSCRFEPYRKAQIWDLASMAWKDVQKAVPTDGEAEALVPAGKRFRIVTVSEGGRSFGEPRVRA